MRAENINPSISPLQLLCEQLEKNALPGAHADALIDNQTLDRWNIAEVGCINAQRRTVNTARRDKNADRGGLRFSIVQTPSERSCGAQRIQP